MLAPLRALRWAFRKLFLSHWGIIQAETNAAKAPPAVPAKTKPKKPAKLPAAQARVAATEPAFDWRPLVVCITAAMALTLPVYFAEPISFIKVVPLTAASQHWHLAAFAWRAGWLLACYVVLPLLVVLFMPRERVRDYHLGVAGLRPHGWALAALALLAVLAAWRLLDAADVTLPGLSYRPGHAPHERGAALALYALQLLCGELFFRGFFLRGLSRTLGQGAVVAMAVPYCMIQYGPQMPFVEVMEALLAGLALGALALRTGSLWGGVLIQLAVGLAASWLGLAHGQLLIALCAAGLLAGRRPLDRLRELRVDWRPVVVLGTVALSLTLQEYFGDRTTYARWFPYDAADPYWHLKAFVWWSGWRVLGYVILPLTVVALMPGERIRDYHLTFRGFFKHMWIYVVLYLLILPALLLVGRTPSFYLTYPFYKLSNRSSFDFWCWQGLYAVQFLSLEIFFRGFMLNGLKRSFGPHAIFVMIVPYCMIHYGKPLPETMGAIFAGVILGTLALRTRSIWCGALIHVSVALTMDWMGLSHCPPASKGACPSGH